MQINHSEPLGHASLHLESDADKIAFAAFLEVMQNGGTISEDERRRCVIHVDTLAKSCTLRYSKPGQPALKVFR